MPCGPGKAIQVFPERTGRIAVNGPFNSSPGYPLNATQPFSPLQSIHDFYQGFFPLSPDDSINPGMKNQDVLIIEGDVGTSPHGHNFGIDLLYRPKDLGGYGEINGKGSNAHDSGSCFFEGLSDPAEGRAAELNIFQEDLVPPFFQPGGQIEEPERHGQAFTHGIRGINEQYAHRD
jgi:hypothetical protein